MKTVYHDVRGRGKKTGTKKHRFLMESGAIAGYAGWGAVSCRTYLRYTM